MATKQAQTIIDASVNGLLHIPDAQTEELNRSQERLKEILDEIAKPFNEDRKYSYDDPAIVAEIRTLLGLPPIKQNKLRYIGIIGCQGSGKDYVGQWLQKNLERKAEVVKFATKLTEVVAAVLCVDDLSLFQDRVWKEKKIFQWQNKILSARDVQISLGTDILRKLVDDDIWVTAFHKAYSNPSILYIATDVRFPNEMDFIQQNNGVVVYIDNREALTYQHRKENGETHSSEKLMWSIHYGDIAPDYILNNNNFDDLKPLQDLLTFIRGI